MENAGVKSTIMLGVLAKNNFLPVQKLNYLGYLSMILVATKNGLTKNFFPPPLWCCCWIRVPGSGMDKNQDPGKTSRIRNTICSWIRI
jgi:hypothetical protein